ncbi:zinc dependent phospholipase C family protein [Arcobacter sp.]|uniref:zinc dependent phospholipase C family protein n=1 Tax=Arcobacter sp. TaxID=1872629 RepID=UPI003D0E83B7
MPGAFAHITLVNEACSTNYLDSVELNDKAYDSLLFWLEYIELGAVSPDYPYLALTEKHKEWADFIHFKYKTKEMILKGIEEIKNIENEEEQQKLFAWLCGFVAHIITDVVIHPVVELKVGPYEGNEKAHRVCEMHQDSYIYSRLNLGEIGMAEHLKSGIATCNDNGNMELIYRPLKLLWEKMFESASPEEFEKNKPEIDKWHHSFYSIVNISEEGNSLFPLARHIAVKQGLTYPSKNMIEEQYIKNIKVPHDKRMDYDKVFDKAIQEVLKSWKLLGDAVYTNNNEHVTFFDNWNLDNGRDKNSNLVFWS